MRDQDEGGREGKDKPDHLEDGSRYPLCREKRSRTEGGRGRTRGFRIDSVQILIVTSPRKARNLRGPFSG